MKGPPILKILVLGAVLLASAATARVVTEPWRVGPEQPFRLLVTFTGNYEEPPGGFEPRVEVDGDVIRVHVELLRHPGDPPRAFTFSADGPPLPLGEYTVRTLADLDGEEAVLDEALLVVDATHVASVEPRFVVAGKPFQLTVRGIAPAPGPEGEPYLDDGVLIVPILLDGSVVTPPPDPRPFELVYDVPALPAGTVPVVLGDDLWPYLYPEARTELEVVPNPVALHDGLFHVGVRWEDFDGLEGDGVPASPPSDDSALFWFFGPENWELMVKVLDACDVNGHYWVLGAASTSVGYEVEIAGPEGQAWSYENPVGRPSEAFADVVAFSCVESDPPPFGPPDDLPQSTEFQELTVEPAQVVPGLPARAVMQGATGCCSPGLRRVERIGRTVRVHVDFPDGGVLSIMPYALSADLGFLEEGLWTVQTVRDEGEGPISELDRVTFEVKEAVESRTVPPQPLAGETVRLWVKGLGTCPAVFLDRIDGERITALWTGGGCLSPPDVVDLPLDLGPLVAGSYEIEVRDFERRLIGGTTMKVLESPVAVQDDRFRLDVTWRDFEGASGIGRPVRPPSDDSALFWFFGPQNWELMVKVLDGCDINGHYWVLGAASTTVGYDLTVSDAVLGGEWTFHNELGDASPAFADVEAFACD